MVGAPEGRSHAWGNGEQAICGDEPGKLASAGRVGAGSRSARLRRPDSLESRDINGMFLF